MAIAGGPPAAQAAALNVLSVAALQALLPLHTPHLPPSVLREVIETTAPAGVGHADYPKWLVHQLTAAAEFQHEIEKACAACPVPMHLTASGNNYKINLI